MNKQKKEFKVLVSNSFTHLEAILEALTEEFTSSLKSDAVEHGVEDLERCANEGFFMVDGKTKQLARAVKSLGDALYECDCLRKFHD